MADHRQKTLARTTAMDVSIATAHRPQHRTHISTDTVEERFTEGKTTCAITDQRSVGIPFLERHPEGNADRFLSAANINAAEDLPGSIQAGHFVIDQPREQHKAKSL